MDHMAVALMGILARRMCMCSHVAEAMAPQRVAAGFLVVMARTGMAEVDQGMIH